MKRYLPPLVLTVTLVLVLGAASTIDKIDINRPKAPNVRGTAQNGWTKLVTIDDTNSTPMTAATKKWTDIDDKFLEIPPTTNTMTIAAYAHGNNTVDSGDPNAGSFSWKLFVCQKYGSAQLVAYGTWAVGELELSSDPENGTSLSANQNFKWCELPVKTAAYWPLEVNVAGTANDIGLLSFDPLGSYGIYIELTSRADCNDVTFVYTQR